MAILDGPLRAVAKNVVGKFGAAGTLTHVATGAYNTTTGVTSNTTTAESVTGVIDRFGKDELGGTIAVSDLKYTIPALGLASAPQVDDTVTIASVVYQVVSAEPVYSGDEVAVYTLALRA